MERELIDFCEAWDQAMVRNNAEEIGSYMHDDWICVGSNGRTSKGDFLAVISSGDLQHSVMITEDVQVNIYGNAGILTAQGVSAGTYKGQPFHMHEWQSNMFVKEQGKWSCVLTMLAPADKSG